MKYLILLLLSLTVITNAYSNTSEGTLDFVNGCRATVKISENNAKDLFQDDLAQAYRSMAYISGYLDSRVATVSHYANRIKGVKDMGDLEKISHKELYGFYTPQLSAYVVSKLIINAVDSDPRLLTEHKSQIIIRVLVNNFAKAP